MGRMDKLNELFRREISLILQEEFQDPRLMFITVLGVEVSPDLHHALIYYSVLGEEKQRKTAAESLDKLSSYIRKLIGQRIRLRYTPQIRFVYDPSIEYSARIEQAFQEINRKADNGDPQGQDHE